MNRSPPLLPRLLSGTVEHALRNFPVVVVTGARQTGKTTLVRNVPSAPRRVYRSLDDLDVLERALREPDLLLADGDRLTLDEVQRAPDLLRAVKRAVDADRRSGRFLLTGSANLLLLGAVSETLAGRAVYLQLGPLTEREKAGSADPPLWSALLDATPEEAIRILRSAKPVVSGWAAGVLEGGFPPVLKLRPEDRSRWFDGYVATYLERDLQQLSSISDLADFRRLVRLAAHRVGGLLNRADLARDAGLSRPTAHRWINLLDVSFQTRLLAPYAPSRAKRLVKSPKVYMRDSGLAAHLAGVTSAAELRADLRAGAWLENLVLTHLDAWRETVSPAPQILFWRTSEGAEVDFVIERARALLPIEVKASTRARSADTAGLERFLDEYRSAKYGLLLYTGTEVQAVTRRVVAAPVASLL